MSKHEASQRRLDGAHRGHPVCSYFPARWDLREPELCGSALDAVARLAMPFEALIEGGASFCYLR